MYLGDLSRRFISQADTATLKGRAEAATFMAAVVPRVYACNADHGEMLYNNLKVPRYRRDI